MRFTLFFLAVVITFTCGAQSYKEMMQNPSYPISEVIEAAESYFAIHGKGKGSGYKGYQRWRYQNESRYYPSGNREQAANFSPYSFFEPFKVDRPQTRRRTFNNGWEELGPNSIDNITDHYSPGLGRVESFYVNPLNTDQIYLGSRSGGFWKTDDEGATWIGGSTDFLPASGVNAIAVSPTNSNDVLINVRNASNGKTHGIYRSSDGGENWVETLFSPQSGIGGLGSGFAINTIYFHPRVPNLIFIGASNGIWRSDDNLATWAKITTGSCDQIAFHPTDDDIIYAHNYYFFDDHDEIWKSTDRGNTFQYAGLLPGNENTGNVKVTVSPQCPNCVYAASTKGVWKSTDEGENFTFLSNPDETCDGFAVSDVDPDHMIYGYLDLQSSEDGGGTFKKTTGWAVNQAGFDGDTYIHADMRLASCVNGVFYVATDGYLSKSTDNGLTWKRLNRGTSIRENYACGVAQSNSFSTICGSQDNGTSLLNDSAWLELYGADGMIGVIHPSNSEYMMTSIQYGSRLNSFDGGMNLSGCTPPTQSGGYWVAPLFVDPNQQMTVYSVSDILYKSVDFGKSWEAVSNVGIGAVNQGAIAYNNSDIIYLSAQETLVVSTDGGVTFRDISGGLPDYFITDIAVAPNNDDVVVVTYNRYQSDNQKVFITYDRGVSWTNITSNLGSMPINSVIIDHSAENNIYLGAEIGIYYKSLDETEWKLYNSNLPNVAVKDLKINFGANVLKAATWGRGLWEFSLVDRKDYPEINYVWGDLPVTFTTPIEGVDNYIYATIDYEGTLSEAYMLWSENNTSFNQRIEMTLMDGSDYRTNDPIVGPAAGADVFYKVVAIGENGDTSVTHKFQYQSKEFQYCEASGTAGTGSDYINLVEMNGVSKSSGKDGYSDFSSTVFTLKTNQTYTLTIGLGFAFDGDTAGAWIDYNNNSLFEESERLVFSAYEDNKATTQVTVPDRVSHNRVRLRTRTRYFHADPVPCGNSVGEVEDYTIEFLQVTNYNVDTIAEACDVFMWYGEVLTASGEYMKTFETADGGDSVVTLNLTIFDNYRIDTSATACDSFIWYGERYLASGNYEKSFITKDGCDSALVLALTILTSDETQLNVSTCENYEWYGRVLSASGTYTHLLTNQAGCDSLLKLDLIINNGVPRDTAAVACDSFVWYGRKLISSGTYTQTITDGNDCEQEVRLSLIVNSSIQIDTVAESCASFTWYGENYTASGIYEEHFETSNGCDSILILDLTINKATSSDTSAVACDSFSWYGKTYLTSGEYNRTLTNKAGCDSSQVLMLTIIDSEDSDTVAIACDSFRWNGAYYYESGAYEHTLENEACSAVKTLTLTIHKSYKHELFEVACDSFEWYGEWLKTSGRYTKTFNSSNDCDSIELLDLTISETKYTDTSAQVCSSFEWYGITYDSSGVYQMILSSTSGCDSILQLALTVNEGGTRTDTMALACNSFAWRGNNYSASGSYDYILTTVDGCDSVITLNLTIDESTIDSIKIRACASYAWRAATYTESGLYGDTVANANTCDSIFILDLTILESTVFDTSITTCDAITWMGKLYAESGQYVDTIENHLGCDSIVILQLTIVDLSRSDTAAFACNSFTWYGKEYTSSGTYEYFTTTTAGCDSVIVLELNIGVTSFAKFDIQACDSFSWYDKTYYESGIYEHTIKNSMGCDSIMTLNLELRNVNSTVTVDGNQLTAVMDGVEYQWVDCVNDFTPIEGAIEQTFIPSKSSYYAVELSVGSCKVLSDCIPINVLDAFSLELEKGQVEVYPNPTTDRIHVVLKEMPSAYQWEIYQYNGARVAEATIESNRFVIDLNDYAQGFYLLKLYDENGVYTTTVMVE